MITFESGFKIFQFHVTKKIDEALTYSVEQYSGKKQHLNLRGGGS